MLSRRVIIGIVIAGLVLIAALFLPGILSSIAKGNAKSRCAELRSQYDEAVRAQDAVKVHELENALAQCNQDLEALGVAIDPGEEQLKACEFSYAKVEDWWRIYINTSWDDTLKRNNNYAAVVQGTHDLASCIVDSLPLIRSEAGLKKASNMIDIGIKDCNARKKCNLTGGYGCGRLFGVYIEPHPNDRASTEDSLIAELALVYPLIQQRREAIQAMGST